MRSIELFAGCGGLAYGVAQAGFEPVLVIERDPAACATLKANKKRKVRLVADWRIHDGDAKAVDYGPLAGTIDLVSGGPPCQPFSIAGAHRGPGDPRNMWREAIRAVRELSPKAFIFENVRGLLRPAFAEYLECLRRQLTWPELTGTGYWRDQLTRLGRLDRQGAKPSYHVIVQRINAADFGAPQQRHRVIVLGVRSDIAERIVAPLPTHSREALIWSQSVTGDYWERHGFKKRPRPPRSTKDKFVLKRLREEDEAPLGLPWATVRDAISDLPSPTLGKEPVLNHRLHPGARVYERHTGSSWDQPAKALKAGDHGVPGGENVLVLRKGAVRYFTIREMARLQGLPDDFVITGTWKGPIRQLGNAVPAHVGRAFGLAIGTVISPVQAIARQAASS